MQRSYKILFAGSAIVAAASAANAAIVFDVRLPGGGKSATVSGVGDSVNLEIFAVVRDANSDPNGEDDAFQRTDGSILSSNGGLRVNFIEALAVSPFDASSHQDTNGGGGDTTSLIVPNDLDGDGDLDIGSNDDSSFTNFFVARAGSLLPGNEFRIGTARVTVTSDVPGGSTQINWRPRNAPLAALWREDGAVRAPTNGGIINVGTPTTLSVVPEPAALGLLGVGGLALLRRRRA